MFKRREEDTGGRIVRPLPETVTGKPTRVIRTQGARGSWDMANHVMQAPLDEDATSRVIRAHEMAHAKHTPMDAFQRSDASAEALRAAEDARVNCIAQGKAMRRSAELQCSAEEVERDRDAVAAHLDEGDAFGAACHAVARTGLPHAYDLRVQVDEALEQGAFHDPQVRLLYMVWRDVYVAAHNLTCAGELVARGRTVADVLPFERAVELAKLLDRLRPIEEGEQRDEEGEPRGEEGEPEAGDHEHGEEGEGLWGEMRIVDCVKTIRCVPRARRRKRSDEGDSLRDVARAFTDGIAFDKRRRVQSRDVLLIDASGSMDVDLSEVEEAVRLSPHGIVACYDSDPASSTRGKLQVLAAGGMRCDRDAMEPIANRNVIDLPALRWSIDNARAGGRVVWITDGAVGGRGGYTSSHARQCQQVVARHGIQVHGSVREYLDKQQG